MTIKELFFNKSGLEIGGPSPIFKEDGKLPIYQALNNLDGCNFSQQTIWEGNLKEGLTFKYGDKTGNQFIFEASELSKRIPLCNYDFIISSNCFEHLANPLKAIEECLKILKHKGILLLVLPKKDANFDHNRATTSFDHLQDDFKKGIKEDDLSHLEEILNLHDLRLDPWAGTFDQFKIRSLQNYQNRALHQHIFNLELLTEIYNFFKLNILFKTDMKDEYLIIGEKE